MTGGGTAGHINPAIAIAETIRLNDPEAEIAFVGIRGGKEEDLVPRAGYQLHYVRSQGIRRSLSPSNIKALWLALTSPYAKDTREILDRFQPDIVIGTGGYACWPIMAAAARRGIPTAVHESNALPGLAVRRLQRRVNRVWTNFEETKHLLKPDAPVVHVGNPLLCDFGGISKQEARRRLGIPRDRFLILSFGGSLGAEAVNRAAISLMQEVVAKDPSLLHLHASGKRDYKDMRALFSEKGLDMAENCTLSDYIYDMPLQMAAADLVIARAGAMTLSELSLLAKPCILIPSPYVADNHQYRNAKALSDRGAAVLVEEGSLSEGALTQAVETLLHAREQLPKMEAAIRAFASPEANRTVWQEICRLIEDSKIAGHR